MKKPSQVALSFIFSVIYFQMAAQWERLSDQVTTEVFVSDTNIFIGTNEGGIFLSNDSGQNWTSIKNNLPDFFIDNIAICDSNKLICSCGRFIYVSENWYDWEQVYQVGGNVTSMVVDRNKIYVGVEGNEGIHASLDNGNSWIDFSNNLVNKYITSVSVDDTTIMISLFGSGEIYRSENGGGDWSLFNQGATIDAIFSMFNDNTFYAGGEAWIFKLEESEWIPIHYTDSQVSDFAHEGSKICATGSDAYISIDAGETWTTITTPDTIGWLKAVEFYDGYILVGNSTGLYRYPLIFVSNSDAQYSTQEIEVYPNPGNDILNITSAPGSENDVFVSVWSLDGNLVLSASYTEASQAHSISVSHLASGLYIVQVVQGERFTTRQIVIER